MKYFSLLLLTLVLWQCSPPTEIGASFFSEESFVVEEAQPLDIEISSFLLDSITSTNSERLMVGLHADPDFGLVDGRAFCQLALDDLLELDEDGNYRYDSLTLFLEYDGYSFYDTLPEVHLSVHQLTETVELPEDDIDLYTTDEFGFSEDPLAQLVFRPRPRRADPVEIRLSDVLGQRIFLLLQEESETLLIESDFLDFFPGLMLRMENEDGAFLGFRKESAQMRLYLTDNSSLPLRQEVRTYSAALGLSYNQLLVDRDNTPLEWAEPETGVESVLAGDQAYIQAGGVSTRIDIPGILSLVEEDDELIIVDAELRFRAIGTDLNNQEDLPRSIQVFWVDEDNSRFLQNSAAQLVLDEEFGRDTYYTLDVKDFIQFQLTAENPDENGLMLQFGVTGNSVDRLVIGDTNHPSQMELRLFTLGLKE
ncbi:MAG: DUF4270 family protein [Bacteroidota bacterium]